MRRSPICAIQPIQCLLTATSASIRKRLIADISLISNLQIDQNTVFITVVAVEKCVSINVGTV